MTRLTFREACYELRRTGRLYEDGKITIDAWCASVHRILGGRRLHGADVSGTGPRRGRGTIKPGTATRATVARLLEQLEREHGGRSGLAAVLAAATGRRAASWERTLYRVMTGRVEGGRTQYLVSLTLVDELLTAAGRPDLYHDPSLRRFTQPRGELGEWRRRTQPRRYPTRAEAKMTLEDVQAAHRLYVAGWSLRGLARELWERHGFASEKACVVSLSERFLREGLPTRNRIEAVKLAATIHGKASADAPALVRRVHRKALRRARGEIIGVPCEATVRGRPCRRAALRGDRWCHSHHPARRAAQLEQLAGMRQRRESAAAPRARCKPA